MRLAIAAVWLVLRRMPPTYYRSEPQLRYRLFSFPVSTVLTGVPQDSRLPSFPLTAIPAANRSTSTEAAYAPFPI